MRHSEAWDMPNFWYSPLMVDVAGSSCVDMYNKNLGTCNAVCCVWIVVNLNVV